MPLNTRKITCLLRAKGPLSTFTFDCWMKEDPKVAIFYRKEPKASKFRRRRGASQCMMESANPLNLRRACSDGQYPQLYPQCFRNLPAKVKDCYVRHPRRLELDMASKDLKNWILHWKRVRNRLAKSVDRQWTELLGRRVRHVGHDGFRHVGHNPYDCLTWDVSLKTPKEFRIFTPKCGRYALQNHIWNPQDLKNLRIFC